MMNSSYISFFLITMLLVFSFAEADSINKTGKKLKGPVKKEQVKMEKEAKQFKKDFSTRRSLLVSSSSSSNSNNNKQKKKNINNNDGSNNVNHISGIILNDPDADNSITDERKEEMESPSINNNQQYKCVWKDKKYKVGEDVHCDPDHPQGARKRCKFVYCVCQPDGSFKDCHN